MKYQIVWDWSWIVFCRFRHSSGTSPDSFTQENNVVVEIYQNLAKGLARKIVSTPSKSPRKISLEKYFSVQISPKEVFFCKNLTYESIFHTNIYHIRKYFSEQISPKKVFFYSNLAQEIFSSLQISHKEVFFCRNLTSKEVFFCTNLTHKEVRHIPLSRADVYWILSEQELPLSNRPIHQLENVGDFLRSNFQPLTFSFGFAHEIACWVSWKLSRIVLMDILCRIGRNRKLVKTSL